MGAPPLLSSLPGAGALPPRSPSGFNKPVQEWPVSRLVPSQHDSRFPRISRTGSLGNFTLELMADWFLLVDERIAPKAQLKVFSDGFFGVDKKKNSTTLFIALVGSFLATFPVALFQAALAPVRSSPQLDRWPWTGVSLCGLMYPFPLCLFIHPHLPPSL